MPAAKKGATKAKMAGKKQSEIIPGVNRLGRSAAAKLKGRFNAFKLGAKGKKTAAKVVATKIPKYYGADTAAIPKFSRKSRAKPTKLKASLTAGSVAIILAGKHKGQRVVFLKQLSSGLLLVTGPFKVNGCPLRRVNQAYVIGTSTKVALSAKVTAEVAKIDDAFFKRTDKGTKGSFLTAEQKAKVVTAAKKATQSAVDKEILAALDKTQKAYLGARFTLTKGQYPHTMNF